MKAPFYKIRGSHGTVLDDWGGKVGLNSAAFQKEYNDGYDHHRIW